MRRRTLVVRRKRQAEIHGEGEPLVLAIPGLACGLFALAFGLYAFCAASARSLEASPRPVATAQVDSATTAPVSSPSVSSSTSRALSAMRSDPILGGKP